MKVFESRSRTPFSSACCTLKRIWKSAAARNQEHVDGWIHEKLEGCTLKINVMVVNRYLFGKHTPKSSRDWEIGLD